MADLRRYTGTKSLQYIWTALIVGAAGVATYVLPGGIEALRAEPALFAGLGGAWLVGLVALGFRERRQWRRLVARSSFESGKGPGRADLHRLYRGHSISVETDVSGLLSQARTKIKVPVNGVDASFTVKIEYVGGNARDRGPSTGNPDLDERFVFGGATGNLKKVLASADVQAALMDVETPGTFTITGDAVVFRVPFTRLTPNELGACSDAVAEIVNQLETIGQGEPDRGAGRGSTI